jgi:hypothetical protein
MNKNIFAFALLIVVFVSCKTVPSKESITGVWKAKAFESTIQGVPEEYMEAGKKEFLSSVYTLNEDLSLEVHSDYFKSGAKGHWEFDSAINELALYYEMDTIKGVEKYNVVKLTTTSMTLKQQMMEDGSYVQITLQKD